MGGCAVVTTPQREDVPYIPALCEAMNVASLGGRSLAVLCNVAILTNVFFVTQADRLHRPSLSRLLSSKEIRYKDIRFSKLQT